MTYTKEQIDRANQTDLVSFLQAQGEQLERAGQEYRWKRHDSLTVRENRWYRHSQSKGGGPIDFVMEFYGKSFLEAVEMLIGERGEAPPPVYLQFRLPPKSPDNQTARNYLTAARRIDEDVSGFFFSCGDLYEEAAHHNAVFVGRDESGIPRYAHQRGTAGSFRLDVKGSDKAFNFCYRGEGERLFVFEAPIDLLSFLCLFKKEWQKQSYLSLGGVSEKALLRFLSDRPNIKTVYLCLDSDKAGTDACSRLNSIIPQGYTVNRLVPLFKDWNEVLQRKEEITDGKYLREAVYGLREPQQEETVEIIRMSEVDTQTVEWLWEPYIPFGKVTIVQGNPGEGKTTLALRLCAACTNRKPFPAMAEHEPFNVIYQTAEDGLGDTVKPRLMEADADLDRVLVIDEGKQELSLSDERIERAIRQTGARLIILDPIQAYVGEKTDMNKANEIRPIFRRLAEVAERTGCAVVLIGHLNKAAGGQSAYRGLGSIDFRAAARSVLLIGRVKREPNVRVIIHDKSSLAPEGKPMAFSLGAESGFSWIGEYDITADELLSGTGGNTETKTEQAERLILDLLADGKEMASEDIVKAAAEAGAGSFMSSFNVVDGIPATGNRWLLTDVLRDQWKFDGFVVSDAGSVGEMTAHGMGDLQQVAALALKAGLDMDMGANAFIWTLKKSLDEGKVTRQEIDQACRRILEAKYKLGLFDNPYQYTDPERQKKALSPEYLQTARELAGESIVLLKNDRQILPLQKTGKIAVIGHNAVIPAGDKVAAGVQVDAGAQQ